MRLSAHLLAPLLAVAAACGGSGANSDNDPVTPSGSAALPLPAMPGDAAIAAMIFDSNYSVPAGFYIDERADLERSFTIHHVLDDSSSYEVCTNDYAEALAWEEADNASRAVQGYFVGWVENDRYYEVARELSYDSDIGNIADITSPGFARIFKCDHTNRNGVDRALLSGYAGRLNTAQLDNESLRVFTEYLWQFAFFPNSRRKVVASVSAMAGDSYSHTLQLAFATTQGPGLCDHIEVAEWQFTASRNDGEVQRQFRSVRTFEATLQSGTPVLCN